VSYGVVDAQGPVSERGGPCEYWTRVAKATSELSSRLFTSIYTRQAKLGSKSAEFCSSIHEHHGATINCVLIVKLKPVRADTSTQHLLVTVLKKMATRSLGAHEKFLNYSVGRSVQITKIVGPLKLKFQRAVSHASSLTVHD
jgi:hypothetical protein